MALPSAGNTYTSVRIIGGLTLLILMTLDNPAGTDLLDAIITYIGRQ